MPLAYEMRILNILTQYGEPANCQVTRVAPGK